MQGIPYQLLNLNSILLPEYTYVDNTTNQLIIMKYNQMTIYMPTVTEVGTKYVQGINRETYIENPANNYWYLLEKVYASGESREYRIREIEYDYTAPLNRNHNKHFT